MRGIFTHKSINLIFVIAMLIISLTSCGNTNDSSNAVTMRTGSALRTTEATVDDEESESETETNPELYIVENLDMAGETISLYSVDSARQLRYSYNMTTKFMDKYGNNSSWANFTIGSVVTLGDTLPSSGALSQVKKSDSVWVYDDLANYTIDSANNIMKINGNNYKITSRTKVYSDTEKILISDVGTDDILTVIGSGKEIISIAVTTGHGYIHITNTSLFNNSLMFIGTKIVSMVYGETTIEVPEGTYPITVANDGWGGTGEYTVTRNETTVVNLEDLKGEGPSYCDITFLITVPDTYVYIDGNIVDINQPVKVRYGNHRLVVECNGYTSWNKILVVNSKSATITLAMESEGGTSSADELQENENQDITLEEGEEETETAKDLDAENDYDYEVDYLSTIADMISNLSN